MFKQTIIFSAIAVLVFALGFGATTALAATATWDGGGDDGGINWSDNAVGSGNGWGNWDSDPTIATGHGCIVLPAGTESTLDLDVTGWGIADSIHYRFLLYEGTILNVPAGGVTKNGWETRGGKLRVTGGNMTGGYYTQLAGGYTNVIEVSSGSYDCDAVWGYTGIEDELTVHIIGSEPSLVAPGTSWGLIRSNGEYDAKMKLQLTLDEDGVTPLTFNSGPWHGYDTPTGFITVEVDEIATYLTGSGSSVGDTIDIARSSHVDGIYNKDRWTTGLVDGGAGSLAFSDDGKSLVLTILPEPASAVLLLIGAPLLALRRRRR